MPTSEARIAANRINARKSTGPKTVEGKERSRANSLKHGLTGQGIVLAAEDAAEVARRNDDLRDEMAPKSSMGAILVLQMATLSVRMERGAQREFAAIAEKVRHAADDFDEARVVIAEELLDSIGEHPMRALRRLRRMPEGVELLIEAWQDLRADLTRPSKPCWTAAHMVKAANLLGIREEDARGSRVGVLSNAAWGGFEGLGADEGRGLDEEPRKAWARARMVETFDRVIAELEAHYDKLDHDTIDQDRAEAGDRALFDPSKEAARARRYESEARRGFFKALQEFRAVEAEAAANPPPPRPRAARPDAGLGSSRQSTPADPVEAGVAPISWETGPAFDRTEVIRGADGRPLTIGRAAPTQN